MEIKIEMTINDIIKACPQTIPVFNSFHIDACCGGWRSLAQAAAEDGIELTALMEALNQAVTRKR